MISMRHTILFSALLLAFGTQGRAEESTAEQAYFSAQVAAGSDTDIVTHVKSTGSRVVELNGQPPNLLREESATDNVLHNETQPGKVVGKEPHDNVMSRGTPSGNIIRFMESAPKRLRPEPDKAEPAALAAPGPPPVSKESELAVVPKAPDEKPLWRMLERQRYAALLDRLERLRARFPHWRPPARLVLFAREGLLRQRIEQAVAADDAAALTVLAQQHPLAFSCRNMMYAWSLASAHAKLSQSTETETVARDLLKCSNEEDRLATLYKAKAWFAADRWEAMLTLEEPMSRSPQGEQKFQQMRYDHRLEQLLAASDTEDGTAAERLFIALASDIDARKDVAVALLGAWNYYQLAQYERAAGWFERVLQWDAAQHEARRGLALCAFQQKRYDAALIQAEALPAQLAGRAELLRDILLAQAQASYGAGKYDEALKLLDIARRHAALPRHAQLLAAWSNMEIGNADIAADEFTRLYRATPELESAQGVLNSLTRAGREHALIQLAQSEPLSGLARQHYAARAFADKRFLAARNLSPERYADLGGVAAPQVSLNTATRSKSGADGLSRMALQWKPSLEAALPVAAMGEFRVRIDRVELDSGVLPDHAVVGRYPLLPSLYGVQPTTQSKGWQPKVIWRDERTHAWEAELGMTPGGGALASEWTGRVTYQQRGEPANWNLHAYREPVRESILSYTGLRDPYEGVTWGRVLKSGALVQMQTRLNHRWSLNAQANAELLSGDNVADNQRLGAEVGIAYDLKIAGFDYAVVGADVAIDRFSKNLSQFTYGHGGYFSPQRYGRIGPFLDFMTAERRNFIIRGRVSIGRTNKREDTTPFFPLNPDGRMYAESSGAGSAYDAEFSAVWRLDDHVQLGMLVMKRHAPQYKDFATLGFVRIFFEPRRATLSSDLRTSMSRDLF